MASVVTFMTPLWHSDAPNHYQGTRSRRSVKCPMKLIWRSIETPYDKDGWRTRATALPKPRSSLHRNRIRPQVT